MKIWILVGCNGWDASDVEVIGAFSTKELAQKAREESISSRKYNATDMSIIRYVLDISGLEEYE